MWENLDLPDANLRYAPDWLAPGEADELFASLLRDIPWEVHRIRIYGRQVDSPRLSCWIGDPGAVYTYSRTRFEARPWLPALLDLRDRLEHACAARFNSVLANLYRDGNDSMGWHSDDEPELGRQPVIASLSLGAERRFGLRRRERGGRALYLPLAHGSLLRMAGDTQRFYAHALPKTRRVAEPRINLTFRWIASTPVLA